MAPVGFQWTGRSYADQMNPRVFLAIPVYGQTMCQEFFCSCIGLLIESHDKFGNIQTMGDSLVTRGRNNLVHQFLKSDLKETHLLFLDADLQFNGGMLNRLLSHDLPLVCGWYPLKQITKRPVFNALPGAEKQANGLLEVSRAGTGIMLIRRDVLERMISNEGIKGTPYEVQSYTRREDEFCPGETSYNLFNDGVVNGEFLSEDWMFCDRWRAMGGQVWIDTGAGAKHVGQIVYPVEFPEDAKRQFIEEYNRSLKLPGNELKGVA